MNAGEEAMQRAAKELPEGMLIQICLENGSGWIELIGAKATTPFSPEGETMTELLNRVIDFARSATK